MEHNTGKTTPCETCALPQANQHSLRESAQCDAIKHGHLTKDDVLTLRRKNFKR